MSTILYPREKRKFGRKNIGKYYSEAIAFNFLQLCYFFSEPSLACVFDTIQCVVLPPPKKKPKCIRRQAAVRGGILRNHLQDFSNSDVCLDMGIVESFFGDYKKNDILRYTFAVGEIIVIGLRHIAPYALVQRVVLV